MLLEVVATSILKYSNGFEKIWLGLSAYCFYAVSIYMFSIAISKLNLAVADTI